MSKKKEITAEQVVGIIIFSLICLMVMAAPSMGAEKGKKIVNYYEKVMNKRQLAIVINEKDCDRFDMFFGESHPLRELSDINEVSESVLLLEGNLNWQYATEPPMDETLKLLTGWGLTKDSPFHAEFAKHIGE